MYESPHCRLWQLGADIHDTWRRCSDRYWMNLTTRNCEFHDS